MCLVVCVKLAKSLLAWCWDCMHVLCDGFGIVVLEPLKDSLPGDMGSFRIEWDGLGMVFNACGMVYGVIPVCFSFVSRFPSLKYYKGSGS